MINQDSSHPAAFAPDLITLKAMAVVCSFPDISTDGLRESLMFFCFVSSRLMRMLGGIGNGG